MIRSILFHLIIGLVFCFNIYGQSEAYICKYLFSSSNDITKLSTDAISLAVDAVWEASGITGTITTTGTLTQNQFNPDLWTYSTNPNNKLVLVFSNGNIVEFTFYSINGYTSGTAEDFKWSHLMDFNTFVQNEINIRINSNTYPQNGKIYWQRTITGTALFDSQSITVNINHSGNIQYDIGSTYSFYTYTEQATGTSNSGSFSVNINESYWRYIANDSNYGKYFMNTEIINNSSGNFGGVTYQYQNARVFWAAATLVYGGYYDKVLDPHQWVAEGTMLKNGQGFGTVQFDGPVLDGTYGPNLILHLNSGTDILLHTLIEDPFTIIDEENNSVSSFILEQNYPNPFNPSTTISWQSPVSGRQTLKVYDVLGNEVATLVDEYKPAGSYEVEFNTSTINHQPSSGVYFYQLKAGEYIRTRKMILMK